MIQIGKGGFLRSIGTNSTIGTIRELQSIYIHQWNAQFHKET